MDLIRVYYKNHWIRQISHGGCSDKARDTCNLNLNARKAQTIRSLVLRMFKIYKHRVCGTPYLL